jgi:hypothetical protein
VPFERAPIVLADRQADGIVIGNCASDGPTYVIQILFTAIVKNPRRHNAAIVKRTQIAEVKDWRVVFIKDVCRITGFDVYVADAVAIHLITCSEVNSPDLFIRRIDRRDGGMCLIPPVLSGGFVNQSFLYPFVLSRRQSVRTHS